MKNSLKDLKEQYKLTPVQAKLLQTLRKRSRPIQNRKLAQITGFPINIITPRVFELRKKLLVGQAGFQLDVETNRTVKTWVAL